MIVSVHHNLPNDTVVQMIVIDCIDYGKPLPRSLAEFRLAAAEAVKCRAIDDVRDFDRGDDGFAKLELLQRSARKGGWLT